MRGIQFLTDHQGNRIAALVNLKEHQAFWQDILEEVAQPREFQFLINEQGEKISVLLDFSKHEELWEDIYDSLEIEMIKDEPRIPWEDAKRQLEAKDEISV